MFTSPEAQPLYLKEKFEPALLSRSDSKQKTTQTNIAYKHFDNTLSQSDSKQKKTTQRNIAYKHFDNTLQKKNT